LKPMARAFFGSGIAFSHDQTVVAPAGGTAKNMGAHRRNGNVGGFLAGGSRERSRRTVDVLWIPNQVPDGKR
jgi:hypothetical protein